MVFNHAYLKLFGQDFFDYTLYTQEDHPYREPLPEDYIICNEAVINLLENPVSLLDSTAYPPKNSTIYLTPKIPYPIDDIRKNYNIKRTIDSGAYNVFGPISWSHNVYNTYGYAIAIFPAIKEAFVYREDSVVTKETLYSKALIYIPNADFDDMVWKKDQCWERYIVLKNASPYKQLLDGTLTKPCCYYKNLDIAGQNELTSDILTLVYKLGSVEYYEKDADKNFVMQLNVLNQHNWREYLGTISILFGELLSHHPRCIFDEISSHKSRYSKVVKELISCTGEDFVNEKDFLFAQKYIDDLLNIGTCRFTTVSDLRLKLRSINLSQSTFDKLFANVARITPKKYNEQS